MKALSTYISGLLLVLAATLIGEVVRSYLMPTNMVMLYLLVVVLAALKLGRRVAVVTAALGVFAFDFFFVPPRFSLTVADKEYLITFCGLFTVGLVISSLVSKVKERAEDLREREAETAVLYRLSRDIASAPDRDGIFTAVVTNASEFFSCKVTLILWLPETGVEIVASNGSVLSEQCLRIVEWSVNSSRSAGHGTASYPEIEITSLPLINMGVCIGTLVLEGRCTDLADDARLARIIDGFAVQLKMALVRIELARQAEQAQVLQARESLERALLNSISHDFRTPLATVTGVLSRLLDKHSHLHEEARHDLLESACSEAERLNRFVGNLLDMTRIESGALKLKSELSDVQELVGCALAAVATRVTDHDIQVKLDDNLPLVAMDMLLMTQVLVNLLDNSGKYAPSGSSITLTASCEGAEVQLTVSDCGHGVQESDLEHIFDKFYRIPIPEGAGGTGLGLAICKGIVEAHNGKISAENCVEGGLKIIMRLPVQRLGD